MSIKPRMLLGACASVTFCVAAVLLVCSGATAAPFQNLDFEEAVVTGGPGDLLPASELLPHWSLSPGTVGVFYDLFCLGEGCISVHDLGSEIAGVPLEGEFSVVLQGPNEFGTSLYIEQVGDVTGGLIELLLATTGREPFSVSLNGSNIPLIPAGTLGAAAILQGDVSAFSGMTATLRITSNQMYGNWDVVDAVKFVPEPSTGLLLALGLVGIAAGRRRSVTR